MENKNLSIEAIVLAGGLGTRLRSAIGEIPKPMAKVAGKPFLEHLLNYWISQGIKRFVLSVAYKHEMIERHFGRSFGGVEIDYAVDEGWGTGGGLLQAMTRLKNKGKTFLVINGDTYFDVPVVPFLEFHQAKSAEASVALFALSDASRFGRVTIDVSQKIQAFDPPAPGSGMINGGIYLFEPKFFENQTGAKPLSLEKDIFPAAVRSGKKFYGFHCPGRFKDIGTPESYAESVSLFHQAGEGKKYA